MTVIVGINAFHGDSSACVVVNGKLIAAVEEERLNRIKHWAGFPAQSIACCLQEAGLGINDVNHFAINSNPKAHMFKKIQYVLKSKPDIRLVFDRLKNRRKRQGIDELLKEQFPEYKNQARLNYVEHHLAHLASSFYVSPYNKATLVSVDGFGDFSSMAIAGGEGADINITRRVYFPHSLGIFYQAITQYLGFPHYGDEYKVMGLAPYGEDNYRDEMKEVVKFTSDGLFKLNLEYFRHHNEKIKYEWEQGAPVVGELFSHKLEQLLGKRRMPDDDLLQKHRDIAISVQKQYEDILFKMLEHQYHIEPNENLCMAGGCAMNSVANGKIRKNTPYKNVYIQAAAGDAGGSIGAAFMTWNELANGTRSHHPMNHAYLGPGDAEFEADKYFTENKKNYHNIVIEKITDDRLYEKTARAISDGKVIGWYQGRMEWGPRALGNRSILGDPRRADMKDILNLKIKRRESFRPFAPSILREEVVNWFEEDDDVPFMMKVFPIIKDKQRKIPAVTHVDGSGRLQTVTLESNERYYKLISEFYKQTGVPVLLNTSFNENEPIVCKPEQAIDTFLRTKMDILVVGDWYLERIG